MSDAVASQIGHFHLEAPLDRVFPLFTAEGERRWAEGWNPEQLSGDEQRGSVFRTYRERQETTWIVIDYRPDEGRASYARYAPNSHMGIVDVQCAPAAAGGTDVSVRYTLSGISKHGRRYVAEFLQADRYEKMIEEWSVATAAALARSEP
jgi:hypothetical protein